MNEIAAGTRDLHRSIWLWCIPLPLLIHLGTWQLDKTGEFFSTWIESESGLIENATALVLIPAAIFAIGIGLRLYRQFGQLYLLWFFSVALVCIGFAGEEISWGQHWVGWHSPEYFVENNRQGETNFHNFNIHFGRVVKSILTLVIIIGGLIMPFRLSTRGREQTPMRRFVGLVTPTLVCVPAAAFVLGVRLIERFKTWFDLEWSLIAVNLKESQELYIALFLLIYVWSAKVRLSNT
jgi:hypothetical protein